MKKLRRISLEDFDMLSKSESSKLMGGTSIGETYNPPYKPTFTYTYDSPRFDPPAMPTYNPGRYGVIAHF